MKTFHYLILSVAMLCLSCQESPSKNKDFQFDIPEGLDAQKTTYYFVRHAEKDTTDKENRDPQLTEEGIRRANFLVTYFKDKSLDMFYSTDYGRTLQTIIPTLHQFKGNIKSYTAGKDTLFDAEFWKATYGKKVLVLGHSNTSPRFMNEILSESVYDDLEENTYDIFFKMEIDKDLYLKDTLIQLKVPKEFSYN
ncbi:histidine phosphatase family protein [Psychroflexus sp. MES1-P1E]|uniref:histidine phosphatase family protein n=1 Tax=Psychroflexus sp. MES1-P1E TaxID=2058320 RepID=UPI000C7B8F0A|nr:phosphoglycerate mutase family protein [Psychroflexus sp. MES1-P1E]PKG43013.1 histidine phosphatase family protein [Psychroflexus sp. MES1-P1E]